MALNTSAILVRMTISVWHHRVPASPNTVGGYPPAVTAGVHMPKQLCARRVGPRPDPRDERPCGYLDEAPPTHLGDWHPELSRLSPGKGRVRPGAQATSAARVAATPHQPFPDP